MWVCVLAGTAVYLLLKAWRRVAELLGMLFALALAVLAAALAWTAFGPR